MVVRADAAAVGRSRRRKRGVGHEMSDVVINATVTYILRAHYIVHLLHSTLLPIGRVLTQPGIIAITIRVSRPIGQTYTLTAWRSR